RAAVGPRVAADGLEEARVALVRLLRDAVDDAESRHERLARRERVDDADADLPVEAEGLDDGLDHAAGAADVRLRKLRLLRRDVLARVGLRRARERGQRPQD